MTIQERLDGFDSWLAGQMAAWKIPGVAVAVVHKGEVVLSQGYGLRDLEKGLPVTPETLFAIGSCSKAFTAFDIALLVEEGKLNWDTPVRQYLPDFRLADPVAAEGMTPRDLVCHRSGLPRHDFTGTARPSGARAVPALAAPQAELSLPRHVPVQQPDVHDGGLPRRGSGGQILGSVHERAHFHAAGYEQHESLGRRFEARRRRFPALRAARRRDQPKAVPFRNLDNAAPAGSINSNVVDMVKWLKVHMYGDESLLPTAALKALHAPHTIMPVTPDLPWSVYTEIEHNSYCLGWAIRAYRGHTSIWHTGGIDGFISCVSFMPNDDFGVIVLTNLGNNATPRSSRCTFTTACLGWTSCPGRSASSNGTKSSRRRPRKPSKKRSPGASKVHRLPTRCRLRRKLRASRLRQADRSAGRRRPQGDLQRD